jgi:hypothetical integral membrane protein (TIGR02206 family)
MPELHYEVLVDDGLPRQRDQRPAGDSPTIVSRLGGRWAMSYVIATSVMMAAAAALATIPATRQFSAYGPSHWTVLVIFVIGSAVLVWIGRRQTESQARLLGRVLGVLTLAIFSVALVYKLAQPSIAQSVPLQLCDLAELTAAYALWSHRKWAFTLTYYWGLPLSSQALITPDLHAPDFPSHSFLTFFALHLLIVWAAIYLTWGYGMRPGWRSYRFAVITTLAWVAFTFVFNTIAGSDYGFLNRKPLNASLLDFLGPWPFYVLTEVAIVGVIWALMTWPWELKRRRQLSMATAGALKDAALPVAVVGELNKRVVGQTRSRLTAGIEDATSAIMSMLAYNVKAIVSNGSEEPDSCRHELMGTSADHIIAAPRDALGHKDLRRSRRTAKGWL